MRLVSYATPQGPRGGALVDGSVYDLEALTSLPGSGGATAVSVREFLERRGDRIGDFSARVAELAASAPAARIGARPEVELVAPIPDPRKVLCIGLNYQDHVTETGRALPRHPDVFAKFASTMIGPDAEIGGARITDNLDFEGELAVIIGRPARNVPREAALEYVAGYAPLNDVTARDLQYRGTQWLAGKAVDSSTPWGPAVATADEVGDPQTLDLVTRVNGIQVQRSNTRHQIFPVAEVIAYLTSFLSLEPGDVIATGTPEGIGAKRTPPMWLQPGDEVEVEIERVGTLRNRVARPD